MESKDPPSTEGIAYPIATRPTPLHLDPSNFEVASDADDTPLLSAQDTSTPSTSSSSTALAGVSPSTAQGRPRSMTQGPPAVSVPTLQGRHRSATVANPPKSAPPGGAPPEREKRKRSRVTPEQLTHLERLFAMDRSPTAAKRKEISEMLGMQERQTQIWFQNRRAKAKTLEGKGKPGFRGSPHSGGDSPPGTPSDFNSALDVDLTSLIHEDDPVTFIPCSDLTIGSWRRISASLGQHDLVAYMSNVKRCLTWFIYSNGYGFKMEIPFDSITRTSIANATAGQALASFYLSCPPLFYLESMSSPSAGQPPTKIWKICQDWTEGQQASKILRHDLVGAAVPLLAALKSIPEFSSPGSALVHSPFRSADTAVTPMHIPQPPLAGLESPPPPPFSLAAVHGHLVHGRKRSFSGPPVLTTNNPVPIFNTLSSQTDTSASSSSNAPFPGSYPDRTSLMFNPEYSAPLFPPFPTVQPPSAGLSRSDFSTVPISHSASRSFSPTATSGEARFSFDSLTRSDQDHFSASDTRINQQFTSSSSSSSSSPLLLTSAFDPSTIRHHDVRGSSIDVDMDTSGFSNPPVDTSQAADPSFSATLDMSLSAPPGPS